MTPKTHQEQPMSDSGVIRVRGARTNNLRNVDVNIAKKQLTVVTGSRDRASPPWPSTPSQPSHNDCSPRSTRPSSKISCPTCHAPTSTPSKD
ncbi:hypothetical protein DEAB109302_15035 [Dermacoccus abyssi]